MNIITAFWGDKYSVEDLKKLPIDYCFSDREIFKWDAITSDIFAILLISAIDVTTSAEIFLFNFIGKYNDFCIIIHSIMADSKKKQTKVYLIPESESRDSHTYHYFAVKTKKLVIENQKLRLKKFNPAKQKHEWFVEAKLPPHSK